MSHGSNSFLPRTIQGLPCATPTGTQSSRKALYFACGNVRGLQTNHLDARLLAYRDHKYTARNQAEESPYCFVAKRLRRSLYDGGMNWLEKNRTWI
jgi:hypothetical protein